MALKLKSQFEQMSNKLKKEEEEKEKELQLKQQKEKEQAEMSDIEKKEEEKINNSNSSTTNTKEDENTKKEEEEEDVDVRKAGYENGWDLRFEEEYGDVGSKKEIYDFYHPQFSLSFFMIVSFVFTPSSLQPRIMQRKKKFFMFFCFELI